MTMDKDRPDSASLDGDGNIGSPADDSLSSPPGRGFAPKSRKPNWTDHEIRALIEEYDRHRNIMRCRGQYKTVSGQVINNEKRNRIWEKITDVVNRSRPEGMNMLGGATVCTRTVKEVIKKWVNLVNKMKSDIAIQRSKPGSDLCLTSRAVNILVNTNIPLDMDALTLDTKQEGIKLELKRERDPFDDDYAFLYQEPNDYSHLLDSRDHLDLDQSSAADISGRTSDNHDLSTDTTTDTNQNTPSANLTTNSVASNVKNAIRKRKLNPKYYNNVTHLSNAGASFSACDGSETFEERRPAKKGRISERNLDDIRRYENDASFAAEHSRHESFQWQTDASADPFEPMSEAERFNRELIDMSRTKMNMEVDRMRLEAEKLEVEKERALIEKESAILQREKLQLEVKYLKQKLQIGELELQRQKSLAARTRVTKEIKVANEIKEANEVKEVNKIKGANEIKVTNEIKEANEIKGANEIKETNEIKGANEMKEVNQTKRANDIKETNEINGANEIKEVNEIKETNEIKGANKIKEVNEIKETNEMTEGNEMKETNKMKDTILRVSENIDDQK